MGTMTKQPKFYCACISCIEGCTFSIFGFFSAYEKRDPLKKFLKIATSLNFEDIPIVVGGVVFRIQ